MLYDAEGLHTATDATVAPAAGFWTKPTAPGIAVPAIQSPRRLQLAAKRALDVAAGVALLVFFAPLLVVIALAIVLVDRMSPLYCQQRYGRNGIPFGILKFRTMSVAEAGRAFTQAVPGDARITRFGAFLRRTSLDELPQLLNVIAGHMSLVGPRPHALTMEEDIVRRYPWAARRLAMRPGMTGLAQVRGLRGPTRRRNDALVRVEADVAYVEGWNLGRDLAIIARTPGAWLGGSNAH